MPITHTPAFLTTRGQAGVGLIEVLVAVAVLSIGLLGVGAMQGVSLRNNNNAYFRTQATITAYQILDEIRTNRREILLRGGWRTDQLDGWEERVETGFPNGELEITDTGNGSWQCNAAACEVIKIRIRWTDEVQRGNAANDTASAAGYDSTNADLRWFELESRI